jgi:lauroyl/myristoyl acyltransferase
MTKPISAGASPFKDPKVEKFIINLQKAFGTYSAKKHKALLAFLKAKS